VFSNGGTRLETIGAVILEVVVWDVEIIMNDLSIVLM